ncbi:hypothetical protein EVAR_65009_1 [Eumeta japonica]|uniref:Uncharacterized protein n=1 Tax=Eumeta variegata TaxID=151549 RepID=A0A4C2A4Z6_EUMVA|nr:hypothetical protein EVAR_65009_1 [Eumeta japonica]
MIRIANGPLFNEDASDEVLKKHHPSCILGDTARYAPAAGPSPKSIIKRHSLTRSFSPRRVDNVARVMAVRPSALLGYVGRTVHSVDYFLGFFSITVELLRFGDSRRGARFKT